MITRYIVRITVTLFVVTCNLWWTLNWWIDRSLITHLLTSPWKIWQKDETHETSEWRSHACKRFKFIPFLEWMWCYHIFHVCKGSKACSLQKTGLQAQNTGLHCRDTIWCHINYECQHWKNWPTLKMSYPFIYWCGIKFRVLILIHFSKCPTITSPRLPCLTRYSNVILFFLTVWYFNLPTWYSSSIAECTL